MGSSAKMPKLTAQSVCLLLAIPFLNGAPAESEENLGLIEKLVNNVYFSIFTQYEMAPYNVIRTLGNEIEERRYSAATWVCTKTSATSDASNQDEMSSSLFWRLFQYIGGENQDQVKYEMTVPVASYQMEMCFFMSDSLTGPPSPPTNPLVFIKNVPERSLFVSRFGGFIKAAGWMSEAAKLQEELANKGLNFENSRYYRVGYDAPFKFWNRRNEIWYEKL